MPFHARARFDASHIASFINIGCSALAVKWPARYCSIASTLFMLVFAEP